MWGCGLCKRMRKCGCGLCKRMRKCVCGLCKRTRKFGPALYEIDNACGGVVYARG